MTYGFKRPEHADFPPIVHVENTNVCNIRCIHCPQADPFNLVPDYRPETISDSVMDQVIDEVATHRGVLRLTPDGETLLPKGIAAQLRRVFQKKVRVLAINTNGLLMEGETLDALLNPGETRLAVEVSLDALYPDSYHAIRKGSDFSRVMANIFTLLRERDARGLKDQIKLMVSIIRQPELPKGEYEQFERFWSPLADKIIHRQYVDTKELTPKKDLDDDARWSNPENPLDRWPCVVPFTRLVVTYDGSIRFCPDDWRKETVIGRIGDQTLAEIWRSQTMRDLRESHLNHRFEHPTCTRCTDWKALKWDFDYLVALNDLFGEGTV